MELSDDKLVELFYTIGSITAQVDELYKRLVGPDGELDNIKSDLERLKATVAELQTESMRRKTLAETKQRMSRTRRFGILIACGEGLYRAGRLAVDYLTHGGRFGGK